MNHLLKSDLKKVLKVLKHLLSHPLRLIVVPTLSAWVVSALLLSGLDYPGWLEDDGPDTALLVFIVSYIFVSQVNWTITLNRLKRLEDRLSKVPLKES